MANAVDFLVGIDGTHDNAFLDMPLADYDRAFQTSHVRHIVMTSRLPAGRRHYVRGPAGLGSYINDRFREALEHVERLATDQPQAPLRLHLAGFSRGAAIALDIANALSRPPQSAMEDIRRLFTFGKSVEVVAMLTRLRNRLAGRLTVRSLALFDPVDMSPDIDETVIGRGIASAALVRRSVQWGSRLGWTNVGDRPEPATLAQRPRLVLDGTHGAMGGMPRAGDIPKPLARALLKQLTRPEDWQRVDARFRQRPLLHPLVRAAFNGVGTFVHPLNGGLLGAAAFVALPLFGNMAVQYAAPKVPIVRSLLSRYATDGGAMYGLVSLQLNAALGSFPGLDAFFVDFPRCLDLIARYRLLDDKASEQARQWMEAAMGRDYPGL